MSEKAPLATHVHRVTFDLLALSAEGDIMACTTARATIIEGLCFMQRNVTTKIGMTGIMTGIWAYVEGSWHCVYAFEEGMMITQGNILTILRPAYGIAMVRLW